MKTGDYLMCKQDYSDSGKSCHRECYFNQSENRKEKLEKLKNYEHNKDQSFSCN